MDLFFKNFEDKNFHLSLFNLRDLDLKKMHQISSNEKVLILNSDYVKLNNFYFIDFLNPSYSNSD